MLNKKIQIFRIIRKMEKKYEKEKKILFNKYLFFRCIVL